MHSIIDYLKDEEIKEYTYKKIYSPNNVVFTEGEHCDKIGIIIKGEVIISTISYNEHIETITNVKEGEMFGHFLIHSMNPYYLGSCISNRKCEILFITKTNLNKLFKLNNTFLNKYLEYISSESIKLKQQVKLLAHKNIEDRIMYYLTTNMDENNEIIINSVTNLANLLALPRPSVSRSISILEDSGKIKRIGKIIKIKEVSK